MYKQQAKGWDPGHQMEVVGPQKERGSRKSRTTLSKVALKNPSSGAQKGLLKVQKPLLYPILSMSESWDLRSWKHRQ